MFNHSFEEIISLENLFEAWNDFLNGKRARPDVQEFQVDLMRNLIALHQDLITGKYKHSSYQAFTVTDPKLRNIHKASVRDRVLHNALYRKLYPYFDKRFIFDSYSCRLGKGTYAAMDRFRKFAGIISRNHNRTAWVLKCDVRKFFTSIDQGTLMCILRREICDQRICTIFETVLRSFDAGTKGVGLPLGNLTSRLFSNIYMNEFDQFMKHELRVKHYVRYADDFVILSYDRQYLECLRPVIEDFLWRRLRLRLHPDKVFIKTIASGVDFLGWVHFPDHRVLRTVTKKRMMRNISNRLRASYLGLCSHGNTNRLKNGFPPARE